MRKPTISIALAGLFLASSLLAQAADTPPVKLVTVDVVKVMASFWKKQQSESQLQDAAKAAETYLDKESESLDQIKQTLDDAMEQSQNTALSKEAQERALEDARRIYAQLQEKGQQAQQFKENKERELAIKRNTDNRMFYSEIREAVLAISKTRGATVVIDTSGTSNIGISTVVYADPAYDITNDVIAAVNKSMPADFKLQAPTTPATTPAAAPAP